jgi:subtilisin family serine protease
MTNKRKAFALALMFVFTACSKSEDNTSTATASTVAPTCPVKTSEADNVSVEALDSTPHQYFIVKLSERSNLLSAQEKRNRLIRNMATNTEAEKISSDLYRLNFSDAMTVTEVKDRLDNADYEYVEPDYIVKTALVSNDTSLSKQWAHGVVHSADAWDISRGSTDVVVGVIDSGVDYDHVDLADNMWTNPDEVDGNGIDDDGNGFIDDMHGWNFVSNTNDPKADDATSYHGTHVAGTIGAVGNNGLGISGHAQVVKMMAIKFLNSSGSGYTSNAIKAIDYAIGKRVKILSNSWGGSSYSTSLNAAIERARAAGILFVVAAGNAGANNDSSSFYPANYPHDNVISVASSTSSNNLSSFSNYGASKVHIAAPGSSIYSTKNGKSYQSLSGTSMATPLVSGVLATMIASRPDLSYLQLKSILLQNVDVYTSMTGKVLSNGRINAKKALQATMNAPADLEPSLPVPTQPGC